MATESQKSPRKLSIAESRQSALEEVKSTWTKVADVLAPLDNVMVLEDTERSNTHYQATILSPNISRDLQSTAVISKLNSFFDQIISSLAAAVARIQLRQSPSPEREVPEISSVAVTDRESSPILLEDEVLEYVISENLLLKTLNYTVHRSCPEGAALMLRWNLLRIFETLVSSCLRDPRLLSNESILSPLLGLFDACTASRNAETDRKMMTVMNELTYCLKQAPDLLELFIVKGDPEADLSSADDISELKLLSYLFPHIHNPGETGQLARSAVLALLRILQTNDKLSHHIAERSSFCQVLVNGLSTFYLSLPQDLPFTSGPGWHRVEPTDVFRSRDIQHFTEYVEFCNATMKLSHMTIQETFIRRFQELFLLPIITPSLAQTNVEESVSSIAFFHYTIQTLEDARLQESVCHYLMGILAGDRPLLDVVLGNMLSATNKLSSVTMSFFHTMLELNYPPVLHFLVLRYFTTEEQSSRSQPADRDVFDDLALAQELLSFIPECCQTLDFAWENKAVEVPVSDNPTTVFQKFMGKKPLEKPLISESTSLQEPPLTLPEYATYLMCARHKLKACWDAFAVDPEVGSPVLSTSSAIAVTSLLKVNPDLKWYGIWTLGPFVSSLLYRLDHMLQNDIYSTLQLTGLISRLALFPHGSIWSALFERADNSKESRRSLLQVQRIFFSVRRIIREVREHSTTFLVHLHTLHHVTPA
ncbi:hypothetical protein RvY_09639-2 [Ramazzottius varieornatus]|uniref:FHF complex subunit HOOK-interacting protein C-terminal domain-containing protein n=1 Tax=Ramazzottius varieornatus TaxID=947166 RepID=A0A1D1VEJ7_RAMVA|nr:hypothetical protein RvY_09639-2 [Ramazzottius varieornatus]